VFCAGPKQVWAVGWQGTVLEWRGAQWNHIASGSGADLAAVARGPNGELWVAGGGGAILHRAQPMESR